MLEIQIRDTIITQAQRSIGEELNMGLNKPKVTIILKDNHREIVGGILGYILGETIKITKFHLSHEVRGKSCGSILLNELISIGQTQGIKSIDMTTNIGYIKEILLNNQFYVKDCLHDINPNHPSYILSNAIGDFKKFSFKHDYEVITEPTEEDLLSLRSKIEREHKNYRRERIYPFNLFATQGKQFFYIFGYTIKNVLYIDYVYQNNNSFNESFQNKINNALKEYIKDNQVVGFYMSSTTNQSKEYLLQKGFEVIDTTKDLFMMKKSYQFA